MSADKIFDKLLTPYACCYGKIASLIPDVFVDDIFSYLLCPIFTPHEEVEHLLSFDFFKRFDNYFSKLVVLYSFISNLRESEFWNNCSLRSDERIKFRDACEELYDMISDLLIHSVMSISGFSRKKNCDGYLVWNR